MMVILCNCTNSSANDANSINSYPIFFSHNRMSMEVASLFSPAVGDTAPEKPEQVPDQESLQPTPTSDAAAVPPPHPHHPYQVSSPLMKLLHKDYKHPMKEKT